MNEFKPGPEWRELLPTENDFAQNYEEVWAHRVGDRITEWVRNKPFPMLPTISHTVIRVVWANTGEQEILTLDENGDFWGPAIAQGLKERISGFEVLSEPRAVTAKAVLDEAEDFFDSAWLPGAERLFSYDTQRNLFHRIRGKFGVDV